MKWSDAIDSYIRDQQQYGRINSKETVRAYRRLLALHAQDTPAGPLSASREDVKRTLGRWEHPTTQSREHSCLRSFYDYLSTEGHRPDNPARQVRRAKVRKPNIYRLTREEVAALIAACETVRERRVILLGVCAGARAMELTFLQGRHFARRGFVWFSADIAKGASERWVPVMGELEAVAEGIRATAAPDHYVINAQCAGGPVPLLQRDPTHQISYESLRRIVVKVGRRAGIAAHVHPHLLRHAYGDHVARHAGLHAAQALMGHANVNTTASVYVDRPDLGELAASVRGLRYGEGATAPVHADVKPPVVQAPPNVRAERELTPFAAVLAEARAAAPLRPVRTLAELQAVIGARSIAPEVIRQLALVGRAHAEGAELEAITTLDVAALAGGGA
jgi:site-specific recombinase XerD